MRPTIRDLDINSLDWVALGTNGLRNRLLSIDPDTKASTRFVNIPQNWKGGGKAHFHHAYEEVFVIKGDVSLTGRDFLGDGSYIYRPAGMVHGHDEQARQGCFCIIKSGGLLELNVIEKPSKEFEYVLHPANDGRDFVYDLRTNMMDWAWTGKGSARRGEKLLSEDKVTGGTTMLWHLPAGWQGEVTLGGPQTAEWIVLKGAAQRKDGATAKELSYSALPAGQSAVFTSAPQGCELIVWNG